MCSWNNNVDTKVSYPTDILFDVSKSDDDIKLMLRRINPEASPKQKFVLTETASELITQQNLPAQILPLDNPVSEELFEKSVTCIEEILGYLKINSNNFKTFSREDTVSPLKNHNVSSKMYTMNVKSQTISKTTCFESKLKKGSTPYEFTNSSKIDGDDQSVLQLHQLSTCMTSSDDKLCAANSRYSPTNTRRYSKFNNDSRETIPHKQSISSAIPIISLSPAHIPHTLSSCPRQAPKYLKREKTAPDSVDTITSANIQKTLRSLSPISPARPPLRKIPCYPGPEDLPIYVLHALDRGCWIEPTRMSKIASRTKEVICNRRSKI